MNEFCECNNPNYVTDEQHVQEAGSIVAKTIGRYCTNCGKNEPPKEPETEE